MKFSYSAVWADVTSLLRTHASLVATIAGVFIFLPGLLIGYFLPPPQPTEPSEIGRLWVEYASANWHWLLLNNLAAMVGAAAILLLVFRRGITVGAAIAAAFLLLPFYFAASLLSALVIGIGFILLVVPGLYLLGRLAPLTSVLVAENRRNPFDAITRTFALTKGHGWAVLGLIVIVAFAAMIVVTVATWIIGILLVLVAGQELAATLVLILRTAGNTLVTCLILLLGAAVYRQLAGTAQESSAPISGS